MAKQRPNIVPIIEDARHPQKYRMLVPMVSADRLARIVCESYVGTSQGCQSVGLEANLFACTFAGGFDHDGLLLSLLWSAITRNPPHFAPLLLICINCTAGLQVDVIFADVAQPDQARIVGLNAQYFLKNGGAFVISIKASCIDSTAPPEAVFAREVRLG